MGSNPKVPLERDAIVSYLDNAISLWRVQYHKQEGVYQVICKAHIDAFQAVRAALIGEILPDPGEKVGAMEKNESNELVGRPVIGPETIAAGNPEDDDEDVFPWTAGESGKTKSF